MREPRHAAILASAGTGKTFALSGRYLSLLLEGVAPERILATTFTRKAAAEILSRVLRRLAEGAASAEGAARLAAELDMEAPAGVPAGESRGAASSRASPPGRRMRHESAASTTPLLFSQEPAEPARRPVVGADFQARCADALMRVVGAMDRLAVSTIDSFLVRVATGATLDIGLPAGWTIVEDDTPIRAEALAAMVQGAPPREMVEILRVLAAGDYRSSVVQWLSDEIDKSHEAYLASGPAAWNVLPPPDEAARLDAEGVGVALGRVRSLRLPTTGRGEPNKTWAKARDALLAAAHEGDWARFVDSGLVKRVVEGGDEYSQRPLTPEWTAALQPLISHARAVLLGAHARSTRALASLIERFDHEYAGLKRRRRVFRFDDVPRALISGGVTGDLGALYYRLDGRIDHVLLDEFQDTSLEQFAIVAPMLDELLAGGERSVFCVGDVKQSLYQWRRAEPELLPAVPKRWPQVKSGVLAENRRSSPTILACVDRVFTGIGTSAAIKADSPEAIGARAWAARYTSHTPVKTSRGFVSLEQSPPAESGDQWAATLRRGAERAAQVAHAAPWASIGVLTRTKRAIPVLIHALRGLRVDASEEGGSALDDSPAVSAVLSALRMIDHPGDSAVRFHVATSPLARVIGLETWRDAIRAGRVAADLRAQIAAEGLPAVLAIWLEGVAPDCSARDLHRLEQLVTLSADHEADRTPRLADFAALVERTPVDDPSPGRVRVMTVHQSKGLEFDAVVLPELSGVIGGKTTAVLLERPDPLAAPTAACRFAPGWLRALDESGRLTAMNRQRRAREFGEALCILYVAMTRARQGLYLVVDPPERARLSYAAILRTALDDPMSQAAQPSAAAGAQAAGARSLLWSDGDEGWVTDGPRVTRVAAPARAAPDATPLRLQLRPVDRGALRHLRRASPSTLSEVRAIDPARLLTLDEERAALRGRMMHAWFERIEWLDDGEPSDDELRADAADAFPRGYRDLDRDIALFRAALRSSGIGRVLRKASYAGKAADMRIFRERPFAMRSPVPGGGDVLLEGRFDRLVVGLDGGRATFAELIDFKTDAAASVEEQRAIVERYAAQMRAYRAAAAALCGIDAARVTTRLALVSESAVVEA